MKTAGWIFALGAIAVFGGLFYFVVLGQEADAGCPGHWHTTFALYTPDSAGNPVRLDMAGPRARNGGAYYDLSNSELQMGLSMHMHQAGSERGSEAHGPAQWHLEKAGQCVSLRTALREIEVDATATSLDIHGAHAQVGQAAKWANNGDNVLRVFIQRGDTENKYTWVEVNAGDALKQNLQDGEAVLVAFGNYNQDQIEGMQAQIIAPISREPPKTSTTSAIPIATSTETAQSSTQAPSNGTATP